MLEKWSKAEIRPFVVQYQQCPLDQTCGPSWSRIWAKSGRIVLAEVTETPESPRPPKSAKIRIGPTQLDSCAYQSSELLLT